MVFANPTVSTNDGHPHVEVSHLTGNEVIAPDDVALRCVEMELEFLVEEILFGDLVSEESLEDLREVKESDLFSD